ncbi:MAG: TIGR02147 family protein [Fibrobacteria bacterium]
MAEDTETGMGMADATPPVLFEYLDYRQYLIALFAFRKDHEAGFSLRKFCRKVHPSPSTSGLLSAILNGKRGLSAAFGVKLSAALALGDKERKYFDLLVDFTQAKGMEEKNHFFLQLSRFRNSRANEINQTQYRFFSKWYFTVLLNFFDVEQRQKNPAEIARRIFPGVSPSQVQEAIDLLLELKMIKRMANGYAPVHKHLAAGKEFAGMVALQYNTQFINLAANVMETAPPKDCRYSTLTFAISRKGAEAVRERMGSFLGELQEIINQDDKSEQVYTMNMQMFPNTKSRATLEAAGKSD